jgi:hypothetical protein
MGDDDARQLIWRDAVSQAAAIREQRVTATALLEAYLDRIERFDFVLRADEAAPGTVRLSGSSPGGGEADSDPVVGAGKHRGDDRSSSRVTRCAGDEMKVVVFGATGVVGRACVALPGRPR